MPEKTSNATPRGPIIISRHGRPALDRAAGPRLDWREYVDWWARYEIGALAEGQEAPSELIRAVEGVDVVLSSMRLRAQQTAQRAAPHLPAAFDALFNEAPLPPPMIPGVRYLPKTWNVLARAAWLAGHSMDGESVSDAQIRARAAATRLHATAEDASVYLAAHGWFNRMLRPELRRLGWACVRDGGDGYWSYRVYEYRET